MRLLPALALIVACSTAQAPSRLSAQIRMPRPKLPNPLSRSSSSDSRSPTFDDRVLEITDARIAALLRGLRAEEQRRPALEAAYRKNADDRAAAEVAARRGGDRANAAASCFTNSPEYRAVYGDTVSQRKVADRLAAARDRGDDATVQRIQDSLTRAMMSTDPRLATGLITAQQRCGTADPATYAAVSAPPPPEAIPTRLPDSLRIIGVGASGLTDDQYSVLRERVLAYLSMDDAERRNSSYAFSSDELSVLRARRNELQRYQEALATR